MIKKIVNVDVFIELHFLILYLLINIKKRLFLLMRF